MFVLSFVNFNPRVLSRMLRTRAQASHGNITVLSLLKNNWFNVTHKLNTSKSDLVELLQVATKSQLFQFDGRLYKQVDGVAMGSPLGPLVANTFLCSNEEQLE